MDEYIDLDNLIQATRLQRHDFMNIIQIIYGYLQLGEKDKAEKYIQNLSEFNKKISNLYTLEDKCLAYCFEGNLKKAFLEGFYIDINMEIERFYNENFSYNFTTKCDIIRNILEEVKNKGEKIIYIYIFEDSKGQSIFIGNSQELVDEMDWIEEWQQTNYELTDIEIFKIEYNKYLAYRLHLKF